MSDIKILVDKFINSNIENGVETKFIENDYFLNIFIISSIGMSSKGTIELYRKNKIIAKYHIDTENLDVLNWDYNEDVCEFMEALEDNKFCVNVEEKLMKLNGYKKVNGLYERTRK